MNLKEMLLRYVEEGTGRIIDIVGGAIDPLGYDDLVSIRPNQPVTMPVQVRHAKVLDEHGKPIQTGRASVTTTLNSPFSSNVIALVNGGWLPSIWAAHGKVILSDRNVVSEIQARFQRGKKRAGHDDFFDFAAKWPIRINPLLYAIEGNEKRQPTRAEIKTQILEAVRKIRQALPNAAIEPDGLAGLQGAIGLIQDSASGMERKSRFLVSVAPSLMATTSRDRRSDAWQWILAEANKVGISRLSFPVLAALSCLASPQGDNPAKRILKPSAPYDEKKAYNALCDFRALELFVCVLSLFPNLPTTLCTMDRNLALFWIGSGIHNVRVDHNNHPTFELRCDKLLPDLTPEEMASLIESA